MPDLLLNHLMRKADSTDDRQEIRQKWSGMLDQMGRRDIGKFLRHMWVSKYGDVKSRGLFREMRSHLEKKKIQSTQFAGLCADECDTYVALVDLVLSCITSDKYQTGHEESRWFWST